MKKSNLIGETLSQKEVKLIVDAIDHSKEQYKEWNNSRGLGFSNGKHLDRWNYIFSNIRDYFEYEAFKTFKINRGALWEFAVIYNTDTKVLYLILKESNFKKIKKDISSKYHYLRIFNSINEGYKIMEDKQLSLLGDVNPSKRDSYVDEDLENLILEIKDEVKVCKNILFTENINGVVKITETMANYDLGIIESCNLTKYIVANIENITDTQNDEVESHPVIELKIREDKMKNKNEDIIKEDKKEENIDEE